MEPYAVYLLRRLYAGESIDELGASESIERRRIVARLRAAVRYVTEHEQCAAVQEIPPERLREQQCRDLAARWLLGSYFRGAASRSISRPEAAAV